MAIPSAASTERGKRAGEADRYHRMVASCSIDGKEVGAEMVLSGHAFEFRRYTSAYDGEEMAARNAKRGLWAGQFADPSDFRRAKREGNF